MTNIEKVHEYIARLIGRASGVSANIGRVDKEDVATVSITYRGRFCRANATKLLSLFGGYTSEQITSEPPKPKEFRGTQAVALTVPTLCCEEFIRTLDSWRKQPFARTCRELYMQSKEQPYEVIIGELGEKNPPITQTKRVAINVSMEILDDIEKQAKEFKTSRSCVFSKRILWALNHPKPEEPSPVTEEDVLFNLNTEDKHYDTITNQQPQNSLP